MDVKLSKWGNSLAVRIPSAIVAEASLDEGSPMRIEYEDGRLQLFPLDRKPSLDELIAGITPKNRHREIDSGDATGGEEW